MKKRVTLDERGYPSIEVRNRDGIYERRVDESAIRKLQKRPLDFADTTEVRGIVPGSNPYDTGRGSQHPVSPGKKLKQRSSLDYLRALSEEIRKKRERR